MLRDASLHCVVQPNSYTQTVAPVSFFACREVGISTPQEHIVQELLQDQRCTWMFKPPHSSHMGGVWERMIGVACHFFVLYVVTG